MNDRSDPALTGSLAMTKTDYDTVSWERGMGEGKEVDEMEKMIFLGWLVLFLAPAVCAQEKVEAPVWNVGDKWVFTGGATIEVIKVDPNMYILNFSKNICPVESARYDKIAFEKSTLHRIHTIEGDKSKNYTSYLKRRLNFPYNLGEEWKDTYIGKDYYGVATGEYSETYRVLGWENVEVKAGKFRSLKLVYTQETGGYTGQATYWYSPEVKYFVKCEYKPYFDLSNWELTSFQLKK